jgi:hypothetical protein
MSSSKNVDLWREFAAGVYRLRHRTPHPPPPYTPYTCIFLYSILIHTGRGGGDLNHREGEMGNSSQMWVENTNLTDCISIL